MESGGDEDCPSRENHANKRLETEELGIMAQVGLLLGFSRTECEFLSGSP